MQIAMKSLGILFLIGLVNPYLILPVSLLSAIIWKLKQLYLKTSRDLKRLEATSTQNYIFVQKPDHGFT